MASIIVRRTAPLKGSIGDLPRRSPGAAASVRRIIASTTRSHFVPIAVFEKLHVLLAEPSPTPFDLRFSFFGVPVRVTPFFWLAAFIFGMGITGNSPQLVVMWIAALFVSILVHEMGHVLAYRYYGMRASIVLYHFGGLAIASGDSYLSSFDTSFRYSRGIRPQQQLVISAAGPGLQLLLGAIVLAAVRLSGHHLWPVDGYVWFLSYLPPQIFQGEFSEPLANPMLNAMAVFLFYPSVGWAMFNLLPIQPMDGGRIAEQLFILFGGPNGRRNALMLSIAAAVGMAVWGVSSGNLMWTLLFGSFAFSSYQLLTSTYGGGFGGGGYGGGRW